MQSLYKSNSTAMPWCIAYGCDNTTHNSLPGVSFHRLPINNPQLLTETG